MGAWGFSVFDNDSSCDFVMDLSQEENPVEAIKKVFDNVINEKEYIELDTACSAWVSICIADQILNDMEYECPDIEYDEIIERIEKNQISDLKQSVCSAIDCILSDISELKELIEECEDKDYENWKKSLNEIKSRMM